MDELLRKILDILLLRINKFHLINNFYLHLSKLDKNKTVKGKKFKRYIVSKPFILNFNKDNNMCQPELRLYNQSKFERPKTIFLS